MIVKYECQLPHKLIVDQITKEFGDKLKESKKIEFELHTWQYLIENEDIIKRIKLLQNENSIKNSSYKIIDQSERYFRFIDFNEILDDYELFFKIKIYI